MFRKFNLIALVVLLSASMMGCTTTQKWMTGGALVGATVGGIWAESADGLNTAQGALVGAATGGAAGALVGDYFTNEEMNGLKSRIDELEKENSRLRSELQTANAELERLRSENEALKKRVAELEDQLKKGARVEMQTTLLNDVLFTPGSARLSTQGEKLLADLATKIKGQYGSSYVTVQGHTDSQPIKYSKWTDNWELGCARSLTVLRYLIKQGVNPEKSSAETFSMYRPVVPNTSPENMSQNRRAVIVVHSGLNVIKETPKK